jgi:hypothetical protein
MSPPDGNTRVTRKASSNLKTSKLCVLYSPLVLVLMLKFPTGCGPLIHATLEDVCNLQGIPSSSFDPKCKFNNEEKPIPTAVTTVPPISTPLVGIMPRSVAASI